MYLNIHLILTIRAAPSTGIGTSIEPILVLLVVLESVKYVCYINNSVVGVLLKLISMSQLKYVFLQIMITQCGVLPCIIIGTCTCEYI